MSKNYIYKVYSLEAKAEYYNRMNEILTSQIDNETDKDALRKLYPRRSHYRRMACKYAETAAIYWETMGAE